MKNKVTFKILTKSTILTFILCIILSTQVLAASAPQVTRIEGKNRVETAIAVSKTAFKGKAKSAIIVGYDGEVDALTGTILAQKKGGPILISGKKSLGSSLKAELKRLSPERVFILGGKGVVNETIEKELVSLGLNVKRVEGMSREETAINIANEAIDGNISEAFLSLGYGTYADALAIGPIAASKNIPLLLTKRDEIKDITLDYLESFNIKDVNIIGGEKAVSESVRKALENKGISVSRIKGSSREETATLIADTYITSPSKIFVASGYQYPDAVVGGYLAAKENAPILLTSANNFKEVNRQYIQKNKLHIGVLGGKLSISDKVFGDIEIAIGKIINAIPSSIDDLKKIIHQGLEAIDEKITSKYNGNLQMSDLSKIVNEALEKGNYTSGILSNIRYELTTGGSTSSIDIDVKYFITKEQEDYVNREVRRINGEMLTNEMSDYEKVKTIHDYIIGNTFYSTDTNTSPHSAYTLFKEGKGVCQAYALAAYKLLDDAGIENYYVTGVANNGYESERHGWNLVKVDGNYYHMDVTWDDPVVYGGGEMLVYDYFLISEERISKSHKMNENNFPKAVDKRYDDTK